MAFCVVSITDNGNLFVDAVPQSWFVMKTKQCYWPPKAVDTAKVLAAIRNEDLPKKNWPMYSAKLMGRYADLATAQLKAEKGTTYSRLTTDFSDSSEMSSDDEFPAPPKKKNKKATMQGASSLTAQLQDLPPFSPLSPMSLPQDSPVAQPQEHSPSTQPRKQISMSQPRRIAYSQSGKDRTVPSTRDRDTPSRPPPHSPPSRRRECFESEVIRLLTRQKVELQQLRAGVDLLLAASSKSANTEAPARTNLLVELLLPVKSLNSLDILEKKLEKIDIFLGLINELSRVGGCSVKNSVARIMERVVTSDVAVSYSWPGKKKKNSFSKLTLAKVIKQAVLKLNETASEKEIEGAIQCWLVRSKERLLRATNILPENSQITD